GADLTLSADNLRLHATGSIEVSSDGFVTSYTERGYCGVGGVGISGYNGNIALTGVNFRIKKSYTPSSISYTTISSNRNPNFVDINFKRFGVAITGEANLFTFCRWYDYA